MTQPTPAEQLLNLADRAERHRLTGPEAARLREGVAHHCARAEKAEAELKQLRAAAQQLLNNGAKAIGEQNWARHHAEERAEKAEAAIERIRDLHKRWDPDPASCAHCVDGYGTPVRYPCPTIAALDEHQEQPPTT